MKWKRGGGGGEGSSCVSQARIFLSVENSSQSMMGSSKAERLRDISITTSCFISSFEIEIVSFEVERRERNQLLNKINDDRRGGGRFG